MSIPLPPNAHSSWGYVILSPHPLFSCALRRFSVSSECLQALLASIVVATEHAPRDLEKVVEVVLDRSRATIPVFTRVVEDGAGCVVAEERKGGEMAKCWRGNVKLTIPSSAVSLPTCRGMIILEQVVLLAAFVQTGGRPVRFDGAARARPRHRGCCFACSGGIWIRLVEFINALDDCSSA